MTSWPERLADYLESDAPGEIRALFRVNARLFPLNLALTTFALLYHFHVGG